MKDYSYELLDLLEKYKGDAEAALRGETSPWCLYAFSPLRENLFAVSYTHLTLPTKLEV